MAAAVAVLTLAGMTAGAARIALAVVVTSAVSSALIAGAGIAVERVLVPARTRRAAGPQKPTFRVRLVDRAEQTSWRIGRWNVAALSLRTALRAGDIRITGLAAEMSYYALISLVPITTALGASLGFLRPLLGDDQVDQIRASIVDALTSVFAKEVAGDVLSPLVDGLLDEKRAGFAIGAVVVTLYLASRVFRAAVRALDDAYGAQARRNIVAQYLLGLLFTLGALVAIVTIALLLVVGPLLGDGKQLAQSLGLGEEFRLAWVWLRWPVAFAVGLAFLTLLYRYAPNVKTTWRQCFPGGVVGSVGLLAISTAFMLYIRLAAPSAVTAEAGNDAIVQAAAQMLSLVLAGVLWLWLGSIVILLGGILNAEMNKERGAAALPRG